MPKGLRVSAWLWLASALSAGPVSAQPRGPTEDAVKVAVVVKLVQFVSWPESAWPASGKPVSLCVLAKNQWIPFLQRAAQGEAVNGHPITVTRIGKAQEAHACQILVVGGTIGEEWLKLWGNSPILTVAADDTDQSFGAMVNLTVEGGRTRFKLNLELAGKAQIRFSSKLLQLAGVVSGGAR